MNIENKRKFHDLKIHPRYYKEVLSGNKKFEIRKNDRDFKEGDEICLREFSDGEYTHAEELWGSIGYLTNYEQREGYVVFTIKMSMEF